MLKIPSHRKSAIVFDAQYVIGKVATSFLREELRNDVDSGTARFVLDGLSISQTVAITKAILNDPFLAPLIDLKLPKSLFDSFGLPDDVITERNATYYRSAECARSAFVVTNASAPGNEAQEMSLHELTPLGAAQLFEKLPAWVAAAGTDLGLNEEARLHWERALGGLTALGSISLERFARYVVAVREAVEIHGYPIVQALGYALPPLRIPCDPTAFDAIRDRSLRHVSAWRKEYQNLRRRRHPYLLKQNPSQIALSVDELQAAFDKARDTIPLPLHQVVETFIAARPGWNEAAEALALCEWEQIKPLFEGLTKEKTNLGRETIKFYEEGQPDLLTKDEDEYLSLLARRKSPAADDLDIQFYERHRNEIATDRKLKSAWDKFIFGRPLETEDFLAGLAAVMETLNARALPGVARHMTIRCDSATKRELRSLNTEAGLYFALRYAGLQTIVGPNVSLELGSLMEFPSVVETWRAGKDKAASNKSVSKAALQLKFSFEMETTDVDGGSTPPAQAQLIWKYRPFVISSQLTDDWQRLEDHPFVLPRAGREPGVGGQRSGAIDLSDIKTLVPAFDRDRGSLLPTYRKERDLRLIWPENLRTAMSQGLVSAESAQKLEQSFMRFIAAYSEAIGRFRTDGAIQPLCRTQATCYSELLATVIAEAPGDRNSEALLRPILELGQASIQDGAPAAIIAPWHPLRLAAMWRKAKLVSDVVSLVLQTPQGLEGDSKLFFKDLAEDLAHPFYPEVVSWWSGRKPELLSLADCESDYSLHEPPVVDRDDASEISDDPRPGSQCLLDLADRYMTLHPHERANMSLVLYNCDSARLPQQIVEGMSALRDDEDIRCQIMMRHTDPTRLRQIYRSILTDSNDNPQVLSPSEATQDFMARLRISVIADQAAPPDPRDGRPYDIVFSQDVISRHAVLEWYAEAAEPADLDTLLPARWSRRRPAAADDLKSAVYLCSPVQSREGWQYLSAITSFLKDHRLGQDGRHLLPVRQLDFRDQRTARIFEETHNLGAWVVNFDELLDRRQLQNQAVRIIRYKQSSTQGRAVVISSRAPLNLLRAMVLRRLEELQLGLSSVDLDRLAEKFITDANDVSGDIVLRAAKRGEAAAELIGVVLSRFLAQHALKEVPLTGWYFLDDYATWLGAREETQADILSLSPWLDASGELHLTVLVTEAKYVDAASLSAKRKESEKQLRDTVRRISGALQAPDRLDRDAWLSRLGDMLLDGIHVPASSPVPLGEWRRRVREGRCTIEILGFSHVFVPNQIDGKNLSDAKHVAGADEAVQFVFGRAELKALIAAYANNGDPGPVLQGIDPYIAPNAPGTSLWGANDKPAKAAEAPQAGWQDPASLTPANEVPAEPIATTGPMHATALQDPDEQFRERVQQVIAEGLHDPIDDQDWLSKISLTTRSALQQLGLQAKSVSQTLTPNAAILRFAGSAQLTTEQVLKKRSELLTTHGLNVIAVRPEPGVVALYVARPDRRVVTANEVWSRWQPSLSAEANKSIAIAVTENDNTLLVFSPGERHAPHTLIAGSTGSGKSVLMQAILLGIAVTNTPAQAQIVLIDPKQGVDYFAFDALPHLDGGIIDRQEEAIEKLDWLATEMDRRYGLFKQARVPNLTAYNAKVTHAERLPVFWIVHDEFAEWMMTETYRTAVTATVGRLGVKARAAGIHLIFAAQRPEANVMPMQLRSQLGNRLILRVDSEGTSELALGERGAERLLGKGHLLARLEGEQQLIYAQVPFTSEEFITEMVDAIRARMD